MAGSGKTTMLSVVRDAFESAGYQVLGTATSGQAARNLGQEAGIDESRTLASLTWRLDHRRISLSDHSVVVLDEVGMTDDPDLMGLLAHVESAGAKIVLVGDHRQLGAVGPGGALEALVNRNRDQVQVLHENLRQADPAETRALAALRAGDVEEAVSWYRGRERIVAAPSRDEAMDRAVDAWAADVAEGKETALLAWRRANVEELNRRARDHLAEAGVLAGPELVAPGGRAYKAGDQVVTLAPGADGALVTSERAVVLAVDPERERLVLRTQEERRVALAGEELSAERLAHGYAVTAHRSQGQTTERTHVYVDGGGRELAYVAMSRARESSHAYLVADNLDQAIEDLAREWSAERRMGWATDIGSPVAAPTVDGVAGRPDLESARAAALYHACLSATTEARRAPFPRTRTSRSPRSTGECGTSASFEQTSSVANVSGDTEAGRAARGLIEASRERRGQRRWPSALGGDTGAHSASRSTLVGEGGPGARAMGQARGASCRGAREGTRSGRDEDQ